MFGRGEGKKFHRNGWQSLFVVSRSREGVGGAHLAGKWNVARGAILPSRIFPTPSSMLHESDSPRI